LAPRGRRENGVSQIIAAILGIFADTVDRLAAGKAVSEEYRQYGIDVAGDVTSPEDLVDAVLADVRSVLSTCQ
jgi:hypothetical protein